MSKNYVALLPIRFGDTVLEPGEVVPVEEGRRYDLMVMLGEIKEVDAPAPVKAVSAPAPAEPAKPDLKPAKKG